MLLALLLGCVPVETLTVPLCLLATPVPAQAEILPGDTLTIATTPVSTIWDSVVYIGTARAELSALDRTGCDECDSCRETEGCTGCGSCTTCSPSCDLCSETLSAIVPALPPGPQTLTVINHYGRSAEGTVTILASVDTGADSGDTASP